MGTVNLTINNKEVRVKAGTTVAAAIYAAEGKIFRRSVSGEMRNHCAEWEFVMNAAL